jgi:hypothetical protein
MKGLLNEKKKLVHIKYHYQEQIIILIKSNYVYSDICIFERFDECFLNVKAKYSSLKKQLKIVKKLIQMKTK